MPKACYLVQFVISEERKRADQSWK